MDDISIYSRFSKNLNNLFSLYLDLTFEISASNLAKFSQVDKGLKVGCLPASLVGLEFSEKFPYFVSQSNECTLNFKKNYITHKICHTLPKFNACFLVALLRSLSFTVYVYP